MTRGTDGTTPRGQSLVEFALVLPMLLVLLLGIADFGRVFAAGITIEAAARNAAEAAAQEYVQLSRNKPGGVLDANDYAHLHQVALDAACAEAAYLANQVESGGTCSMPLTAVCVHDGNDPDCGVEADPSAVKCVQLNAAWDATNQGAAPAGAQPLAYVEVRICYRFNTIISMTEVNLPFGWNISMGEMFLERGREFAVADY